MTYLQRLDEKLQYFFRRLLTYKKGKLLILIIGCIIAVIFSSILALEVPDYPKNIFNSLLGLFSVASVFLIGCLVGDAL